MTVLFNGTPKEISQAGNISVQSLLALLDYNKSNEGCFAVAINMEFIPKSSYGDFLIKDGDKIEIVSPTAGG